MRKTFGAVVLAMAGALAPPAHADETTFCNVYITSVPYTITTQGHYCFNKNLSTAITTGAAITIAVDYVVLDLNNFKLGGGAAGAGTLAFGVYAFDHDNLTVRGGNIRGFAVGINVSGTDPTSAENITVERNVVDGNLQAGIMVRAGNAVLRDNVVTNTGGSTAAPADQVCDGTVFGIADLDAECMGGFPIVMERNKVFNTGMGPTGGIAMWAPLSIVVENVIQFADDDGIVGGLCRDNSTSFVEGTGLDCVNLVGSNFEW